MRNCNGWCGGGDDKNENKKVSPMLCFPASEDDPSKSNTKAVPDALKSFQNDSKDDERIRKLYELLSHPGNEHCADCTSKIPFESFPWLVANEKVFVCIHCSSVHRSLGSHISKVRSTQLDIIEDRLLGDLKTSPNIIRNSVLEYHVPDEYKKPNEKSKFEVRNEYIRAKYEKRLFEKKENETRERKKPTELSIVLDSYDESSKDEHVERVESRLKDHGYGNPFALHSGTVVIDRLLISGVSKLLENREQTDMIGDVDLRLLIMNSSHSDVKLSSISNSLKDRSSDDLDSITWKHDSIELNVSNESSYIVVWVYKFNFDRGDELLAFNRISIENIRGQDLNIGTVSLLPPTDLDRKGDPASDQKNLPTLTLRLVYQAT